MTIVASHVVRPRPSASAGRAFPDTCPKESAALSGPVTPTARPERRVALLHLQLRRDLLADRLRSLQRQSRNKEASACSAELRAVTTKIMRMGRA